MKSLRTLPSRFEKQMLDLGLFGRSDYVPFVVVGRSRVGSNLLRGLLNAHPDIEAFGEVFRDRGNVDWDHTGYFQSRAMRSLVQRDPVRFLDAKVLGRYPSTIRAVGFKLFYYHAREGAEASVWPYLLQRHDIRVIHLKRRNLLHTHVSRKRAAMTDRWVNTSSNADQAAVVHVDYQECLDDFVRTRSWEEESDRYFDRHQRFEMHYERLASNYVEVSAAIQAFLGVEPHPVTPTTFQQAREPLSRMIANYGELKEKFRGSVWEEFFTD